MTFERRESNGKQIAEHLRNRRRRIRKKKEATYTFLTTMYHGISSMRSLERNRKKRRGEGVERGTNRRHKQKKKSHFFF